eukprot:CAMPEP_0113524538 /NCGR_PEP_ID=MMETSP0014_2-20120614/46270_1 /TAXON_ID=2857 /ORGANISM="Nitzschia sp." /LENGTH=1527 /DNA_ID=CAMNT_0000422657 /DNA_START=287 /DNA_END=4870 /DNA_ORIENTATION=+ /assembly_acc=CAM_ASM_000159
MSSLRLALKQSLQEAGLSGDDADVSGKKRRKKNRSKISLSGLTREQQQEKKQRQKMKKQKKRESANSGRSNSSPGGKKRGPGRPRKHPRPDDEDGHDDHEHDDQDDHTPKKRGPGRPRKVRPTDDAGDNDDRHDDHDHHEDDHHDDHDHRRKDRHNNDDDDDDDGHSSSENEFSSSSGEEEEDTDDDTDDDGSDDGSDDDDDDDDDEEEEGKEEGRKVVGAVKSSSSSRDEHQEGITPNDDRHHPSVSSHRHREGDAGDHDDDDGDDGMTEEELRRKKRKLLKKKLKHSAANKIQSQWKKKKAGREGDDDTQTTSKDETSQRKASSPSKGKKPESSTGEGHDDSIEKKKMSKKKRHGIVDKPIPEIVEWHRNMSDKRCRKHIAIGMRVKVRFAVPVKRDGKTIKKKTWYGGRVTAVSKMGSKIRIKYDDGTSEVSGFPDEDIVVDCDDNGEHSVSADRFLPPEMRQGYQGNDERRPSLATVDSAAAESKTTVASAEEITEAAASMEVETVSVPSKHHGGDDDKQREEISPKTSNDDSPEKPTANPAFQIQGIKDEEVSKRTDITESNKPTTPTNHPSNNMDTSTGERHGTTVQNTFGSPEEGELSPGMTVKKDEPSQQEELKIATSPVPMEIDDGMTKATVNADLSMTELKETNPPSKTDPMASTTEEGEVSPQSQPTKPLPGHKLTVDIPIENITKETVSPKPSPRMEKIVCKISDGENVTTGTSVEASSLKRKREGPQDETDEKEAPPKQKIKLKIPVPKPDVTTTTGIEPKVGIEITEKNDTQDSPDVEMSVEATKPVPMQSSATMEEDENVETPKPAFSPTAPSKSSTEKDVAQPDNYIVPHSSKPVDVEISNESAGTDVKSPEEHSTSEERVVEKKQEESKTQLSAPSTRTEATSLVTSSEKDLKKITVPAPETSQEKVPAIAGLPESLGSGVDDQITSLNKTKSNESFNAIAARGGRKAAMEAMEKMTAKDKKEKNPALEEKKKKRKPRDDADASEDKQDWVNEMEWVQCDSCHKWRVLPSNVKVSDLPNKWYCNLNVYDPKRNTCDAPEQTAKQALKELKRAKKRARRLEQLQAEKAAAGQGELGKESEMKTVSAEIAPIKAPAKAPVKTPVKGQVSPKPSSKQVAKVALKSKDSTQPKEEDIKEQSNSGSEDRKVEKKKRGKKGKIAQKQQQQQQQQQPPPPPAPETDETRPAESTEPAVEPPKKKRRGRPPRNTSGSSQGSSENADNVEWVQCEQCSKWRKLPADLSADELPDVWVCSMNTWNTSVASCKAAEETTDAQHQEVGTSEWQLRQTHAGKYSYRAMIFGTGAKKQNRPMSERSRAAESLFQSPDDDERPYPICMYSKSSMFLPRTSNFHKSQLADDKSTSIFGVLSDSNMFSELRDMHLKPPVPDAYTSLGRPGKISMSDLVLDIIGDNAFTGDQIVAFAKATQVGQMATYCNTDIIVNTLLSLVKDGVLEMSCLDPSIPMHQWVPQFRRTRTPRARQIVDKIKSSSNIKISKPWKRRATEQEWVTGGNAS